MEFVKGTRYEDAQERVQFLDHIFLVLSTFESFLQRLVTSTEHLADKGVAEIALEELERVLVYRVVNTWLAQLDSPMLQDSKKHLANFHEQGALWALQKELKMPILASIDTINKVINAICRTLPDQEHLVSFLRYQVGLQWTSLQWEYNFLQPSMLSFAIARNSQLSFENFLRLEQQQCLLEAKKLVRGIFFLEVTAFWNTTKSF
jgi:hypothetical protein